MPLSISQFGIVRLLQMLKMREEAAERARKQAYHSHIGQHLRPAAAFRWNGPGVKGRCQNMQRSACSAIGRRHAPVQPGRQHRQQQHTVELRQVLPGGEGRIIREGGHQEKRQAGHDDGRGHAGRRALLRPQPQGRGAGPKNKRRARNHGSRGLRIEPASRRHGQNIGPEEEHQQPEACGTQAVVADHAVLAFSAPSGLRSQQPSSGSGFHKVRTGKG